VCSQAGLSKTLGPWSCGALGDTNQPPYAAAELGGAQAIAHQ
jgi:hypothetical protein